jgi:hypothetical protein
VGVVDFPHLAKRERDMGHPLLLLVQGGIVWFVDGLRPDRFIRLKVGDGS